MAITILAPVPASTPYKAQDDSDDSDEGGVDLEGDIDMRPAKRARKTIVTPGEIITEDPQWMRYVCAHITFVKPTDSMKEDMEHSLHLPALKL